PDRVGFASGGASCVPPVGEGEISGQWPDPRALRVTPSGIIETASRSRTSTRTQEITKEGSQMVEDLRRLGGEAGVIAGLALGWLLLGILVVWPAAGLSFGAEFNPNRILPW